jgi:hypothetical protein
MSPIQTTQASIATTRSPRSHLVSHSVTEQTSENRVGRTGFEPVTSSVSGKRSPAELTAPVPRGDATRGDTPPRDGDRAPAAHLHSCPRTNHGSRSQPGYSASNGSRPVAAPDGQVGRDRQRRGARRGRGWLSGHPHPDHRDRYHERGAGTPSPAAPGLDCTRPGDRRSSHSTATAARCTFSIAFAQATASR